MANQPRLVKRKKKKLKKKILENHLGISYFMSKMTSLWALKAAAKPSQDGIEQYLRDTCAPKNPIIAGRGQ